LKGWFYREATVCTPRNLWLYCRNDPWLRRHQQGKQQQIDDDQHWNEHQVTFLVRRPLVVGRIVYDPFYVAEAEMVSLVSNS